MKSDFSELPSVAELYDNFDSLGLTYPETLQLLAELQYKINLVRGSAAVMGIANGALVCQE
jgi:hypothetical protein